MDKWTQHEGLDRASILLSQMETCFGYYDSELTLAENKDNVHPSIWNEECGELLGEAFSSLWRLYQKIGEWEEGVSEGGENVTQVGNYDGVAGR